MRRLGAGILGVALAVVVSACASGSGDEGPGGVTTSPTGFEFGKVAVGNTAERELELRNEGRARVWIHASDFPESLRLDPPVVELAPGRGARVRLVFSPTSEVELPGVVRLSEGPELRVEGRGVEPALQVAERMDFGNVEVGSEAGLRLEVRNRSDQALRLEAEVEPSSVFLIEGAEFEVPAAGTTSIRVGFRPEERGPQMGLLHLRPCSRCAAQVVELVGRGLWGQLLASSDRLDFGLVAVGLDVEQVLTVRNGGERAVSFEASIEGDAFEVVEAEVPKPLPVGGEGRIVVRFAPTTPGRHEATLRLREEGRTLLQVPAEGIGGGPLLQATPAAIDFGDRFTGRVTEAKLRLENVGEPGSVWVTSISVEGDSSFSFAANLPLEVTEAVELTIWFLGDRDGTHEGTLVLKTSWPAQPELRIPLHGNSHTPTECELAPEPEVIRFGLIGLPVTETRTVRLKNVGATSCLFVRALAFVGDDAPHFSLVGPPDEVLELPAGGELPLVVRVDTAGASDGDFLQARLEVQHGEPEFRRVTSVPLSAMASSARVVNPSPVLDAFEATPIDRAFVSLARLHLDPGSRYRLQIVGDASSSFVFPPTQALGRVDVQCAAPPCEEEVRVVFMPKVVGEHRGRLEVSVDEYEEPILLDLGAEATAPCPGCDWPEPYCGQDIQITLGESHDFSDSWPYECHWGFGTTDAFFGGHGGSRDIVYGTMERASPHACSGTIRPFVTWELFHTRPAIWNLRVRPDGKAAYCGREIHFEAPPGIVLLLGASTEPLESRAFVLRGFGANPYERASWFDPASTCVGPDQEDTTVCNWGPGTEEVSFQPLGAGGAVLVHIPNPQPFEAYHFGFYAEAATWWGRVWSLRTCSGEMGAVQMNLLYHGPNTCLLMDAVQWIGPNTCSLVRFSRTTWPYRPFPSEP